MSSILTNTGAMTALETLRNINRNMNQVQTEISTGKKISNAKDNGSIWAISSVMDSDVKGFKAVADSLALGDATVGVARNGAETVVDLLNEMKAKIVAAQEENVDRDKIQADVRELGNQIQATVDASQFNGLNLLQGDADSPTISMLGSLNRTGAGLQTSSINVERVALGAQANIGGITDTLLTTAGDASLAETDGASATFKIDASQFAVGTTITIEAQSYTVTADDLKDPSRASEVITAKLAALDGTALGGTYETVTFAAEGDELTITRGGTAAGGVIDVVISAASSRSETATSGGGTSAYTLDETGTGDQALRKGGIVTMAVGGVVAQYEITQADMANADTDGTIATNVAAAMNAALTDAGVTDVSVAAASGVVTTTNNSAKDVISSVTIGDGKLSAVAAFDVTTADGAKAALAQIDGLIQVATGAAASFGTAQKRMDMQSEFVNKVMDSFKAGIGALVDADMEEASARLQALQVQQQLGTQALSIANQQPQSILSLFR